MDGTIKQKWKKKTWQRRAKTSYYHDWSSVQTGPAYKGSSCLRIGFERLGKLG